MLAAAGRKTAALYAASQIGILGGLNLVSLEPEAVERKVRRILCQLGISFGQRNMGINPAKLSQAIKGKKNDSVSACFRAGVEVYEVPDLGRGLAETAAPFIIGRLAGKEAFVPVTADQLVRKISNKTQPQLFLLAKIYAETEPVAGLFCFDPAEAGYVIGLAAKDETFDAQGYTEKSLSLILNARIEEAPNALRITHFDELAQYLAAVSLGVFGKNYNKIMPFLRWLCFEIPEGAAYRDNGLLGKATKALLGLDIYQP